MEGIITIIIIYFVASFAWGIIKSLLSKGGNTPAYAPSENFKIRAENAIIKGESFTWDTFKIEMRGSVSGPYENCSVKLVMQILDVTDGTKELVFSTYEDFQKADSEVFWFESESFVLPYKDTIYTEWVQVVQVPKLFLDLPRKGLRSLEFKVYVVNALNDNILVESATKVSYNNPENGYKDAADNTKYFEEMVVKASMLVSASDGKMDAAEAKVVNSWIQKRISRYGESFQAEHKERLNGYVKDVYREIQNNDVDIYEILEGIDNITSEGDRFELFQVCLDVAQADGEADRAELDMVREIADIMNLDEKQFKSMIEKTLPITMHTGEAQTLESLVGITSDMTTSEIKKHLRETYKKWNQRVAHSDPEIRAQANKMIEIVAELRKKYS